ncbi:IS110 family transposase [Aquimarina sp. ERC-38]|uniref:IS110 family transposase n=1 Tax=Aquimarina sp. ERC-38 TaxID=2949996 RepID=UPI0022474A60|nr:IS110 family transposase [Aquimarina sp. ERC-38]UZO80377.1 IS110 family transposase [Aquimarina sp. ERC-38]
MNKQNFSNFIGIDISKLTFDVAILINSESTSYVFENTVKGIKAFLRLLKNQKIELSKTLICMEHTGVYSKLIITKLIEKQANLCVEMSLKIIRSLGLQRGKNDQIDAIRIAKYAAKNHEELELYKSIPELLEKIKTLITIRERLVKSKTDLTKYPKELKTFAPELGKLAEKNIKKTVKTFTDEIKRIEQEIHKLILSDDKLSKTINLATSVTGIGKITALHLTIYTNFFTRYQNPKQLACYCGVVPFEHSSGTSIRKRARVDHMANKTLKKQLHLCALSAKTYDPELNAYYERKVEEGKPKMLVINNIRNKLVHRVCAVIRKQQPYEKKTAA